MMEEINILQIKVDSDEASEELEKVRKELAENQKQRNELNKKIKEGVKLNKDELTALKNAEKGIKENTARQRELVSVITSEQNSLDSLTAKLSQLTRERRKVDTSTEEGRKKFNDLTKQIKEYSDSIKRAEEAGGNFTRSVGNYQRAVEGFRGLLGRAGNAVNGFANGIGNAGKAFNALPIFAVIAGLKQLADILSTNSKIANEFAEIFAGFGNAVGVIIERLTNVFTAVRQLISGELTLDQVTEKVKEQFIDFGKAVTDAYTEGREAKRMFNELKIETVELELFIDKQNILIEQQKTIAADQTKTAKEREQALRNAIAISNRLAEAEARIAQKSLNALLLKNKATNESDEDKIERLKLEREVEKVELSRLQRNKEIESKLSGFLKAINDEYIAQRIEIQKTIDLENEKFELTAKQALEELALKERLRVQEQILSEKDLDRQIEEGEKEIKIFESIEKQIRQEKQRTSELIAQSEDEILQAKISRFDLEAQIRREKIAEEVKDERQKALLIEQINQQLQANIEKENLASAQRKAQVEAQFLNIQLAAFSSFTNAISSQLDESTAEFKIAKLSESLISAFAAINKTLSEPALPFPANVVTASAIGAQLFANVASISAAAGGGTFMTTKPTMLMVGDNPGGVERVTVEPISGRGQTKVSKNSGMIAMAGGGTLVAGGMSALMGEARNSVNNTMQLQSITNAIQKMPSPIVTVKDIDTVSNRVRVSDNANRL